jgi:enoyl-CoA hydratase/carnithine racemase
MSKSTSAVAITTTISDGVAAVEIDNQSQRNALTKAMCIQLAELMPRLNADPDVVVVTLRGAGSTFSAGAAINDLTAVLLDKAKDGSRVDHLSEADSAISRVAKPTVALVDGSCMGGGWQLASACDFIVASERSLFAITPAKLGVIYPRVGIERLVRQVGPANAKFILFTGETFTAERARELRLITEVAPDADFEAQVEALVSTLRNRSQFSIHSLKHLIDVPTDGGDSADREWDEAWNAMSASPDMGIGINAFLSREEPQFSWRPDRHA